MFEFFDAVLDFFAGIGRIFELMWTAITGFMDTVGSFISDYITPIVTFLPRLLGGFGVVIEVCIVLFIALAVWEAIN